MKIKIENLEEARDERALAAGHRTTAKSQNACRRRNTGTSAVLQNVGGNSWPVQDKEK